MQVRTVETREVQRRLAQSELGDDVLADAAGRGRREREYRDLGKALAQDVHLPVFGPEIVTPFGNAVGLVDGEARQALGPLQGRQKAAEEIRQKQSFRRQIKQLVLAAQQRGTALGRFAPAQRRIEEGGGNAVVVQEPHLILHQRDQRRDHHHDAGP